MTVTAWAGGLGTGSAYVPPTPILASSTTRTNINQQVGATNIPGGVTVNAFTYDRYREKSSKTLTNLTGVFWNGSLVNSAPTAVDALSTRLEQANGSMTSVRGGIVTGPTGTGVNVGGAGVGVTWSGVKNNASIGMNRGVDQFIWKNDTTTTPSTVVAKTYAQFVADGGSVSDSTVNGVTLANSLIVVPSNYLVMFESAASVTAAQAYYVQIESGVAPSVTLTGVTASSGSAVLQFSATPHAYYEVGGAINVAGATGNTTVNGASAITAIDRTANTVTIARAAITSGAVTGTVTARTHRPVGASVGNVTFNPLGDYTSGSATVVDLVGKPDWTGRGQALTDQTVQSGFLAIFGTDATGTAKTTLIEGDSIAWGVGDRSAYGNGAGVQNSDADGASGFLARAMNAASYPFIKVAVAGINDQNSINGGAVRLWLAGFCEGVINEMGHNDATALGTYVPQRNTQLKAALRGSKRVVQTTMIASVTAGTSGNYATRAGQVYTTGYEYPSGVVWGTSRPAIMSLAYNNDAYLDLASMFNGLDGTATLDGYAPADGTTSYRYSQDGVHPGKDGHTGLAAALTAPVLATALGY